jgi:hypothetical protein
VPGRKGKRNKEKGTRKKEKGKKSGKKRRCLVNKIVRGFAKK